MVLNTNTFHKHGPLTNRTHITSMPYHITWNTHVEITLGINIKEPTASFHNCMLETNWTNGNLQILFRCLMQKMYWKGKKFVASQTFHTSWVQILLIGKLITTTYMVTTWAILALNYYVLHGNTHNTGFPSYLKD